MWKRARPRFDALSTAGVCEQDTDSWEEKHGWADSLSRPPFSNPILSRRMAAQYRTCVKLYVPDVKPWCRAMQRGTRLGKVILFIFGRVLPELSSSDKSQLSDSQWKFKSSILGHLSQIVILFGYVNRQDQCHDCAHSIVTVESALTEANIAQGPENKKKENECVL